MQNHRAIQVNPQSKEIAILAYNDFNPELPESEDKVQGSEH